MADIVNTNQFRNGMHIEHRGSVWRIVEFQHVKPGKGGAFVRTKLKNLETGAVVDDTFRAGEKFPRVHTEVKNVQFLYDDGSEAHFMDEETYEQFALPSSDIAAELAYMLPSSTVQILQVNGNPSGIQMPASVELTVAETEPGVAANCLWPKTTIATAAVAFALGGQPMIDRSRKPEIVADAALAILAKDPKDYTGNAVMVEDVLAAEGVTDLSRYAVVPGQEDFQPDIYVD